MFTKRYSVNTLCGWFPHIPCFPSTLGWDQAPHPICTCLSPSLGGLAPVLFLTYKNSCYALLAGKRLILWLCCLSVWQETSDGRVDMSFGYYFRSPSYLALPREKPESCLHVMLVDVLSHLFHVDDCTVLLYLQYITPWYCRNYIVAANCILRHIYFVWKFSTCMCVVGNRCLSVMPHPCFWYMITMSFW